MSRIVIDEPSEKQQLFLRDRHKYIAYGGARGGGKSWAVRVKAVLLALRFPGIKLMIIRRTYNELQKNHIQPLIDMLRCYDEDPDKRAATYNEQKKLLTFPTGSTIQFQYCEKPKDASRLQGTEVDVLFIDEATHQTWEVVEKLLACVRGANDFPKRVYYTCNPGGPGHAWVKRLFIDRSYREGEDPADYFFIKALVTDNRALMEKDPDYIRKLKALNPKLRAAWLNGDWTVLEGQFFEEFRETPDIHAAHEAGVDVDQDVLRRERRWTHVIDPFEIPEDWKIYRSFDWGYSKPFSCAWWAMDHDGVLYRILEFYGCQKDAPNTGVKLPPQQVFQEIARLEREHRWLRGKTIRGVADPAIWNGERGESIAETAAKCGVYFEKGDHQRNPGWMQMHYRLHFDENGYPMMYIFSNCAAFIRTIPLLQYDEYIPEDLDTDGEDHVADETRYLLMARPIEPRVQESTAPRQRDAKEYILDIKPEDLPPASRLKRMEVINDE